MIVNIAIQTNQQAIFFPSPTTSLSLQFVLTKTTFHFRYYCQCKPAWEHRPAWEQAADKYYICLPNHAGGHLNTFHIIYWTWKQNNYYCCFLITHRSCTTWMMMHWYSTVSWTYPGHDSNIISIHLNSSHFPTCWTTYNQQSPLAEPRLQYMHSQVVHRQASSWTEPLRVLIVCMDVVDILVHPSWSTSSAFIHLVAHGTRLQKKKQKHNFSLAIHVLHGL